MPSVELPVAQRLQWPEASVRSVSVGSTVPQDPVDDVSMASQNAYELAHPSSHSGHLHPPRAATPHPAYPQVRRSQRSNPSYDRRRAERIVDQKLYHDRLSEVLNHELLSRLRLQIIEQLIQTPLLECERLCRVARRIAGESASALAHSMVVIVLAMHVKDSMFSPFVRGDALADLYRDCERWGRLLEHLAVMHHPMPQTNILGGHAVLRQQWLKELLIARIDPPARYWSRWCETDMEAFKQAFRNATASDIAVVLQTLENQSRPDMSEWTAMNLAVSMLNELGDKSTARRLAEGHPSSAKKNLQFCISHSMELENAAICMRILGQYEASFAAKVWTHTEILQKHLTQCLLADLLDIMVEVSPDVMEDFVHTALQILPPWAEQQQARLWLEQMQQHQTLMGPDLIACFRSYLAPQCTLEERRALFDTALFWQHKDGHRLQDAQRFIRRHVRSRRVAAEVLQALLLSPKCNPQLRDTIKLIVRSPLDAESQRTAISRLRFTKDNLRPQQAWAFIGQQEVVLRKENLESSMQPGRLSHADRALTEVCAKLSPSLAWRPIFNDIVAHIEALQSDQEADPLLKDCSRTGLSELTNALHTLTGERQDGDAVDALVHNPPHPLRQSGKVVGLGYLTAGLWRLMGAQLTLLNNDVATKYAHVDFVLALARSTEDTGYRVCSWGISERLIEAVGGHIEGITWPLWVYPAQLLTAAAQQLSVSDERHTQAGQELFFHRMLNHAEEVLHSPEAIAAFASEWLDVMRLDYDWPDDAINLTDKTA